MMDLKLEPSSDRRMRTMAQAAARFSAVAFVLAAVKVALVVVWLALIMAVLVCAAFVFWTVFWVVAWAAGADPHAGYFTLRAGGVSLAAFAVVIALRFARGAIRDGAPGLMAHAAGVPRDEPFGD